jgi:hypothetical protein
MKNPWKFENFKKGILTTVVGLALLAAAVYVYLMRENSEVFALALLGLGALAFGLKDPKIPGGGATVLLLVVSCWLLTGCVTYQRCIDKYSVGTDTVRVEKLVHIIDTIKIAVPGDSLNGQLSFVNGDLKATDTVSDSGKLRIKFIQVPGGIQYRVVRLPDTVVVVKRDTVRVAVDCTRVLVDADKNAPWYGRLWETFKFFAAVALLVLFVCLLIYLKHRNR